MGGGLGVGGTRGRVERARAERLTPFTVLPALPGQAVHALDQVPIYLGEYLPKEINLRLK